MKPKYDAAEPKSNVELNPAIKIKEPEYKKTEYSKSSLGKSMNYEFWARFIERGKNYVGLLQQFIRNSNAESSVLAVYDVSRRHTAAKLAEEERIKENAMPHLAAYRPENPPQNIGGRVNHQKARKNPYLPYNPQYEKPYGAKAPIEGLQKRIKAFYREFMDYAGRLAEKLNPKQSSNAPYNSPEAPIKIRELTPSKYAPFTAVYEAIKPRGYTKRINIENESYDTLEDLVRAA